MRHWLLSRDAQVALQRDGEPAGSADSARIDFPQADGTQSCAAKTASNIWMWNPNWMNMKPVEELINQVMSEDKKD
ncbi:MAG: hypothetical protein ACXWX7_05855 [Candidatus Binatia bacterium]